MPSIYIFLNALLGFHCWTEHVYYIVGHDLFSSYDWYCKHS